MGVNPQQSTSTRGENVKKIPGKGASKASKSGQHGRSHSRVVPSGDGGPSGRGHGPAHMERILKQFWNILILSCNDYLYLFADVN